MEGCVFWGRDDVGRDCDVLSFDPCVGLTGTAYLGRQCSSMAALDLSLRAKVVNKSVLPMGLDFAALSSATSCCFARFSATDGCNGFACRALFSIAAACLSLLCGTRGITVGLSSRIISSPRVGAGGA